MITAGEQINGALRLIGVLAEGELPSAAMSIDALLTMSQMIDSWSTERLSVYVTQDQVFSWPANEMSRTIGPSGNFVGNRPLSVDESTYFKDTTSGLSYGISIVNQEQYNGISLPTATSIYPQYMYVNQDYPNLTLSLFPVPTRELEFHFVSVQELKKPESLTDVMIFPPGYLRAFRYNLAAELAPEYGIEPSPTVIRIAMTSKRNIKRINNQNDKMSLPTMMISSGQRFNIFSGN
jgi:hypothetical protein